ncbi:MAG: histidine kinase [Bacteroidetes bacterium]|nr:histidine kinase [Bacteroidota bacterium]
MGCFTSKVSIAQNYVFRHLTTTNGMLSDLRICLTEDRIGRLWIGSEEGINVFDGYQLSSYSKPDNSALSDNNITNIFCDKQGTIWVSTPSGVQYKKENTNKFVSLKGDSLLFKDVSFFAETAQGDIVIVDAGIVYRVHEQRKITKLSGITALVKKYKYLTCVEKFEEDQWFFGANGKLMLVDLQQDKLVNEFPFRNVWCLSKVSDSIVMAGSFVKDSIVLINTNTGIITCINDWPSNDGFRLSGYAGSIYPIGNNRFAIGCRWFGIYIVDLNEKRIIHLTHNSSDESTIASNNVRRLHVTRTGFMFVHAIGICYTQLRAPQINSLAYLINESGEKYDGGTTSFVQDEEKNLWVSTNRHLAYWNRKTGISRYYPYYTGNDDAQKIKTVRAVALDRLNRVWVGSFGGGIGMLRADGLYDQIRYNPQDLENSIPSNEIQAITLDSKKNFFLCCNSGFAYFNPINKKVQTFYKDSVLKEICQNHTYSIVSDSNENWWIGQYLGLFFYDRKAGKLHTIEFPKEVNDFTINSIAIDQEGNVYAGGKSGLFIIPKKSLKITKWISKKDGLVSNIVNSLLCDQQGTVWLSGNIGLAAYHAKSDKLEMFNASDGVIPSNHNLGSIYMSPDREIFLASQGGINYFSPDSIRYEKKPLNVYVTSLELNDSTLANPVLNDAHFTYNNNNFSFTYLVVDFNLASSIQYRYKLVGFDTTYINAGKQRTARYTNLAAGHYRFIVEASANGRDWYACSQSLSFTISQAFWTTWWFRMLFFVVILVWLYYFYKHRIALINKEATLRSDYEIKLNELENSALRTQMNPHFIFNSLNTINSFINRNEPAKANQYISKFAKLIRLILDHSRQKKISLAEEVEVLELYIQLERIRFDNKFEYHINIDLTIETDTTEIPPLVLQPFVENSILHGLLPLPQGGRLMISIQKLNNTMLCIVEDNGIGRQQARKNKNLNVDKRKSHGIDITLKRIDMYNREHQLETEVVITDLKDHMGSASGTRVEIPIAWVESF